MCHLRQRTTRLFKGYSFSSFRTMQQSTITQNLIREHFSGSNCSNVYEIHGGEKLGKGSYGSVYLSTHRRSGDNRAIKVMNVDNVTSYYLRKLHTEISVLKSIDHPNIIKLHEVFWAAFRVPYYGPLPGRGAIRAPQQWQKPGLCLPRG